MANYKIRLVDNEIAYEFNFTDKIHLNRAFKKHKG
jgi:AraC-like DNA-binding protein